MLESAEYGYGDSAWKDLLTSYDGADIYYSGVGLPDFIPSANAAADDVEVFWNALGKVSETYSGNGGAVTYTYDANGQRLTKTSNGVLHKYYYEGARLLLEQIGGKNLIFLYDESGNVDAISYSGTKYYLVKNLQGDVVQIRDKYNAIVAEYTYNAYGYLLSVRDANGNEITDKSHIANINPIRYRGYYYDSDTRLYYLNSRYYSPELCRFISADGEISGVSTDVKGYNLFAYCFNDPVNMSDPDGNWPDWNKFIEGVVFATVGVLTVAAVVATGGTCAPLVAAGYAVLATAGVTAAAVGVSEVYESFTDTNPLEEAVGEETYEDLKFASATVISAGPTIISTGTSVSVCFVEGTLIAAEYGKIPIEEIKEGTLVWASNPDTGETELKEVVRTFVNETSELIHVSVGGEEIITTPKHPFYVPKKGWIEAVQLRAGDRLQLLNGEYVIIEQVQHELLESPVTVYNFEVEDFHTYYVSDSEILVHNKCEWDTARESSKAWNTVKGLNEKQTEAYDQAILKLVSGDTSGLNVHRLSNGYYAADLSGFGKGRGAGRIIFEKNGGIIEIIEVNLKHYKK